MTFNDFCNTNFFKYCHTTIVVNESDPKVSSIQNISDDKDKKLIVDFDKCDNLIENFKSQFPTSYYQNINIDKTNLIKLF
jgi:hypothetical protein